MKGYVLVVESDPDLQRRIGDSLRATSYEIAAETEASWAKRSVAVRTPDAIVLDTSLTDGPGFALADELRRGPETRDTPILFVASRQHRGASHRAEVMRRYAPAGYLIAPAELGELPTRLNAAVLARAGRAAVPRVEGQSPGRDHPTSPSPSPPAFAPAGPLATTDPAQRREKRDVERTARTLASASADLRGTLKRTLFARLLQRLFARRQTGSLLLMKDT